MACILPYKQSKLNSKQFLRDLEIIDETDRIINDELFDQANDQIEQDVIEGYNLNLGKPWFRNPLEGQPIIPNDELFETIDQRRKDLGLYEDRIAGTTPIAKVEEETDKNELSLSDNILFYKDIFYIISDDIEQYLIDNKIIEKKC